MSKTKTSKEIINNLINSDFEFKDENGNAIDIPKTGNLGLLASGYKGLVAVRKKRNKLKTIK
jgi:hypothetical protein